MGVLGTIVGAAIDRRDGDSGIKGAIVGAAASRAASAIPKLLAAVAIGWGVQKAVKYARRPARKNGRRTVNG